MENDNAHLKGVEGVDFGGGWPADTRTPMLGRPPLVEFFVIKIFIYFVFSVSTALSDSLPQFSASLAQQLSLTLSKLLSP